MAYRHMYRTHGWTLSRRVSQSVCRCVILPLPPLFLFLTTNKQQVSKSGVPFGYTVFKKMGNHGKVEVEEESTDTNIDSNSDSDWKISIQSKEEAIEILKFLMDEKVLTLDQIQKAKDQIRGASKKKDETTSFSSVNASKYLHGKKRKLQNTNVASTNPTTDVKTSKKISNISTKSTNANKDKSKKEEIHQPPMLRHMTRHIALRFHYDGRTYTGLAENVNSETDQSVERVLFAALKKSCLISDRQSCTYSRSGRTDKGVSAFGQVVALRVTSAFPIGTRIRTTGHDGDGAGQETKVMQECDLPRNSMEKVECLVPPRPNKKKKKKKNQKQKENVDSPKLVARTLGEKDFAQVLNNILPPTIRVLGWTPVSDEFSARFSTASRTYRYFFARKNLNLDAMDKGLQYMVGRHDFRNLCKMNCEEVDNFERVITHGKIVTSTNKIQQGAAAAAMVVDRNTYVNYKVNQDETDGMELDNYRQMCYFEIRGQAFLWHQIRCIVSILFMIGQGLEDASVVKELLDIQTNPGKPSYPFAPEKPLVLHACLYNNLNFGHSVQTLWRISCALELKWEELALAAEQILNGIMCLREEAQVQKADAVGFVKDVLDDRRRKVERCFSRYGPSSISPNNVFLTQPEVLDPGGDGNVMSWGDALHFINDTLKAKPFPEGPTDSLHLPLMKRCRGTTFEEKVQALSSLEQNNESNGDLVVTSQRRKERYQENLGKKTKASAAEGRLFYKKMLEQGGSGF